MEKISISKKSNTEKLILKLEKEMKTALPLSKQYLEGQLYLAKKLNENGIDIPENFLNDNYGDFNVE